MFRSTSAAASKGIPNAQVGTECFKRHTPHSSLYNRIGLFGFISHLETVERFSDRSNEVYFICIFNRVFHNVFSFGVGQSSEIGIFLFYTLWKLVSHTSVITLIDLLLILVIASL
jgi:hypothetical protein